MFNRKDSGVGINKNSCDNLLIKHLVGGFKQQKVNGEHLHDICDNAPLHKIA
jgi:hypothetical protein